MAHNLPMDQEVLSALMALCGQIKPYHDKYFIYAAVADKHGLTKLVKYLRKRSHKKGTHWKDLLFYVNRFGTPASIPPTPEYLLNESMELTAILQMACADEIACREAVENVMTLALARSEQRVLCFLKSFIKDYAKAELKLSRMLVVLEEVQGDVYEFMELM